MTTHSPQVLVLDDLAAVDLPHVVEIEERSFDRPWSLASFRRELGSAVSRILVARVPGPPITLVGYVCRWRIVDELQVQNLAVDPAYRRRGVGSTLMARVLQEARERNAERVTLEVREGNTAAIRLYESLGFVRVGVRPGYYGRDRDGVLMTLTLPSCRTQ